MIPMGLSGEGVWGGEMPRVNYITFFQLYMYINKGINFWFCLRWPGNLQFSMFASVCIILKTINLITVNVLNNL